jgi:Malectin domain
VFDVVVENALVAGGFDAVKLAGPSAAVVLERIVAVTDGGVTIQLVKGIELPIISGIEIIKTLAPVPAPTPVPPTAPTPLPPPPTPAVARINVGGGQLTDPSGNIWEADNAHNYYNTGVGFYACPQTIANTINDDLYCTYRSFNQAPPYFYQIPVSNGNYNVRLHFAET